MNIVKAKYDTEWISRYIDKKYSQFDPVVKYRWQRSLEGAVIAVTLLFIVITDIIVIVRSVMKPWSQNAAWIYILASIVCAVIVYHIRIRKILDPRDELNLKCFDAFAQCVAALDDMEKAYMQQEIIQEYVEQSINSGDTDEIIAGLEKAGIVYNDETRLCFTGLDEETEKYINMFEKITRESKDAGLI